MYICIYTFTSCIQTCIYIYIYVCNMHKICTYSLSDRIKCNRPLLYCRVYRSSYEGAGGIPSCLKQEEVAYGSAPCLYSEVYHSS